MEEKIQEGDVRMNDDSACAMEREREGEITCRILVIQKISLSNAHV